MAALRLTTPRLLALGVFLDDPERERYGLDVAREAGLEPGTIYPILVAFENAGWLRSREEDVDPHLAGRPPPPDYLPTPHGGGAAPEGLPRRGRGRRPR